MPTNEECDAYAIAVVEHFDAFVSWTIAHWPDRRAPLSADEFRAGRREVSALLGARLDAASDGEIDGETTRIDEHTTQPSHTTGASASPSVGPSDASEQYVNMNPTPWP